MINMRLKKVLSLVTAISTMLVTSSYQIAFAESDFTSESKISEELVVNTDGTLSDIYVIKPLDPQCDQEAIRIIQSMPRWIPGRHNGVAVPVYYLVPVTFKI